MKGFIMILMLLLAFVTLYTLTFSQLTVLQAFAECLVVGFGFAFLIRQYNKVKA